MFLSVGLWVTSLCRVSFSCIHSDPSHMEVHVCVLDCKHSERIRKLHFISLFHSFILTNATPRLHLFCSFVWVSFVYTWQVGNILHIAPLISESKFIQKENQFTYFPSIWDRIRWATGLTFQLWFGLHHLQSNNTWLWSRWILNFVQQLIPKSTFTLRALAVT